MFDRVLIDGVVDKGEPFNDRAFQYGDGLFETIAVATGRPCLWGRHMRRLAEGCRRLRLPSPDPDVLLRECVSLAAGTQRAILKLYWTAGDSPRGYRRPDPLRPRRILRLMSWPPSDPDRAWRLRLCNHRLGDNPALAGIKHLNRLDQVLARAEWSGDDFDEGLMLNRDGHVLCGTMSNLFLQSGDRLVTPPLEAAGVAGVVRGLILDNAIASGSRVDVQPVTARRAMQADAVYLTNSLSGVVRAASLDGATYDLGLPEHPLMAAARGQFCDPERAS